MNIPLTILLQLFCASLIFSCKSVNKPYNYKRFPENYSEIQRDYEGYYYLCDCQSGEVIASIGAGNGMKEIWISCFVEGIDWYLQEIDS
jgi:hypothetical protein